MIVQEFISGSPSGVTFSVNPVNNENNIVIESTFGLNNTITSGKITPDIIYVDRDNEIISSSIGSKKIISELVVGEIVYKEFSGSELSLSQSQIIEISKTAQQVEDIFGCPQDIEWIYKEDSLYLLQARPVVIL